MQKKSAQKNASLPRAPRAMVPAAVTLQHSEQLIGADTHPAHFESSKKAPIPCRRHATPVVTTLDSVPPTLPKGLLASAWSDSTRGFAPTKNSNLRQAPASRDIPCLTNLALLPWDDVKQLPSLASVSLQARQIAGQCYRYFGFHFLVVLPSSSH
jgi:hypothetical protein